MQTHRKRQKWQRAVTLGNCNCSGAEFAEGGINEEGRLSYYRLTY